jgi:uncharacterized protein (DUF1499 family)
MLNIVGLILSILLIGSAIGIIRRNLEIPDTIGIRGNKLAPMPPTPNAVSSQTQDLSKYVDPLPLKNIDTNYLEKIEDIVKSQGGVIASRTEVYLHAIFTSKGLRFKDDVEFLVNLEEGVVHYRSGSRVGSGDMGVNRNRYEAIKNAYVQSLKDSHG